MLATGYTNGQEAVVSGNAEANTEAPEAEGEAEGAGQTQQDDLAPLTPRQRYNIGRERLAGGDASAAGDAFLAARDDAGADAELRYRAAFNLGLAFAAQADSAGEEPEQAIALYRDSAAWFADAVRGAAENDDDARVNLELVQRRIQQLADQLNQGRGLEQRLERTIDDQRDLRDRMRRLLADASAEAPADGPDFAPLASHARMLLADAGDIADLAGEERALLDSLDEAERTPEQTVRAIQLAGLESYVHRARQSISDSRRRLRRNEGERAHRRADAALAELKRAYEQLMHPVTVLKAVAGDELALAADTNALAGFAAEGVRLNAGDEADAAQPPAWLTTDHLSDRQEDALVRSVEMLERFESAAATPPPADGTHDPEAARLIAAAQEATPPLTEAVDAMRNANQALERADAAAALPEQVAAVQALARAIERFAGIRELIELAHAGQSEATALLDPESDAEELEDPTARLVRIADDNQDRLARLDSLLAQELEAASGTEAGDEEETPPEQQRAQVARQLTASAQDAVQRFDQRTTSQADALRRCGTAEGADECRQARTQVHAPADEARRHIAELRRLYYTIVEHLRELGMEQAETHDRAATAQFERQDGNSAAPSVEQEPPPGAISARQGDHAAAADAIATALAEQADATAAANQGGEAPPFAEAAREVRQAAGFMHGAFAVFDDTSTTDWEPALADQLLAMDHIAAAIALLEPPNQNQNQQGQDSQGAQDQQSEDDEQMSRRQALKRLQAIRDRDAERQRRRQASAAPDPVEKDW